MIENPDVADVFASYPDAIRDALLDLRALILETAEETDGVGGIEETLRWSQPSYLTSRTGSGSTIRIAPCKPDSGHDYAMYFICRTTLVDDMMDLFGDLFTYEPKRALLFRIGDPLPVDALRQCVAMALTYHLKRSAP